MNNELTQVKLIKNLIKETKEISFLLYTENTSSVIYLSLLNTCFCLSLFDYYDFLKEILESSDITKITIDAKGQMKDLRAIGISLQGPLVDIGISQHILDSSVKEPDLSEIIRQYCPGELLSLESCCLAINKAWPILKARLELEGLLHVHDQIEMPLVELKASMETTGIGIDVISLKEHIKSLTPELKTLESAIYNTVGFEFKIGSPRQLSEVLYGKLGYVKVNGASTETDVLKRIHPRTELINLLLEYKDIAETLSEGKQLLKHAGSEGIIRPQYTLSETGRMYTREPNFQGLKRCLKKFLIAKPGNILIEADYSQIQFRLLAAFSSDPRLVSLFRNDEDLHTIMASKIFKVSIGKVSPEQRKIAKVFNFGILFGMTAKSLSAEVHAETGIYYSPAEMEKFIKEFKQEFPGVEELKKETLKELCDTGCVVSLSGRKRYFKDAEDYTSTGRYTAAAKRKAFNFLLQGSEADIVKKAMISLAGEFERKGMESVILGMVHDSIIFSVPQGELVEASNLIKETMENSVRLKVPLKVDYKFLH